MLFIFKLYTFVMNLNTNKMKKYYYLVALAISLSFASCGDDSTPTPSAPTTDEIIGTYTGTAISTIEYSAATNGIIPDSTETDTDNKIVIAKGSNGYTMSLDDNNPTTPPDPVSLIIQDVLIANNGTTFRIPTQQFSVGGTMVTIQGTAYAVNGTTPAAGLYTRNDKALRFEFEGLLQDTDTSGNPISVGFTEEYNTNKQ